jgi:hypothetical protein
MPASCAPLGQRLISNHSSGCSSAIKVSLSLLQLRFRLPVLVGSDRDPCFIDICGTLVLVSRLEGCPQDRSVPGTQVRFMEVVSRRTRRYDQECYQGSDSDAFERCHTGNSGAGPGLGRLTHLFDYRPATPFGRGGSERSLQPDQVLRVRCELRHMGAFKFT